MAPRKKASTKRKLTRAEVRHRTAGVKALAIQIRSDGSKKLTKAENAATAGMVKKISAKTARLEAAANKKHAAKRAATKRTSTKRATVKRAASKKK